MPYIKQVNSSLFRGVSMGFGQVRIHLLWKRRVSEDGLYLAPMNSSSSAPLVTGSVEEMDGRPLPLVYQKETGLWIRPLSNGEPEDGDEGE